MILPPPTSLWLAAAAPPPDPMRLSGIAALPVNLTDDLPGVHTIMEAPIDPATYARYTYPPPSRTHRRGWKAGRGR